MAKVFDLIHKVNKDEQPPPDDESRIPFDDQGEAAPEGPRKKRLKIEMAFFYVLLFVVFFLIGVHFVSPDLFAGLLAARTGATPSPETSAVDGPQQGLTIEKEGESISEAQKDLNIPTPTPSESSTSTAPAPPPPAPPPATQTASVQVLNGTTRTGAAATTREKLVASGIAVASIGNYHKRSVQKTTIFYHPDYKAAAEQIQGVIGGILSETTSGIGNHNVLVVVGLGS